MQHLMCSCSSQPACSRQVAEPLMASTPHGLPFVPCFMQEPCSQSHELVHKCLYRVATPLCQGQPRYWRCAVPASRPCMAVDRRLQAGQVGRHTEAPQIKLTCLHLLQLAAAAGPVWQLTSETMPTESCSSHAHDRPGITDDACPSRKGVGTVLRQSQRAMPYTLRLLWRRSERFAAEVLHMPCLQQRLHSGAPHRSGPGAAFCTDAYGRATDDACSCSLC